MIAQEGRTYAQIVAGKVHWIFTRAELPEWCGIEDKPHGLVTVDITDELDVQVGDDYDGVQFTPAVARTLEGRKGAKRVQVTRWRDAAIYAPFEYAGHMFDGDEQSQTLLNRAIRRYVGGGKPVPGGFVWRSRDNVSVPMTAADLGAIDDLLADRLNTAYATSWALKALVDAAVSLVELDSIAWPD